MKKIKTVQIHMKLSGRMTQLPDSQKIFGALIYLYEEHTSREEASRLVSAVKEGNLYVALSNMLPAGRFPLPQQYLLETLSTSGNGMPDKKFYKAVKERQYISEEDLKQVIREPGYISEIKSYAKTQDTQQIHVSIDSLQYRLPGLDPNSYSVPEVSILDVEDVKKENKEFYFYLAVEQGDRAERLLEILKQAKDRLHPFFLGPRASQGMNLYYIDGITPQTMEFDGKTTFYLNMGMLLPGAIDLKRSYLKLFTSQRRPYQMPGGWDQGQTSQFISFIQAGSVVALNGNLEQAGRSVESPYDSRAVIFGSPFLYPLKEVKGGREDGR